MSEIFCTDCGSECELVDGSQVTPREPAYDGDPFWRCPVCPDSYAKHIEARGGPGDPPSGLDTKAARVTLFNKRVEPLIEQALRENRNARDLAKGRILGWLAAKMKRPNPDTMIGSMGIEDLKWAWTHLGHVSYRDITRWAADPRKNPP